MNAIETFMIERDVVRVRSKSLQKLLVRAAKYVSRLNYMRFSQFEKPLEQMTLDEFNSLVKWKKRTISPCIRTVNDDSDSE